eukprot:CAMPEP_0174286352 /NCGR_PEP_ID=MMETSP0809-20121228/11546_1 /TAXON_ID=73025 ORGANISM="Eutreptiella gymnastica-like, Strain CCMP1594" /NCGR_SAMPLE_ID=MMETSP0809 /ASSEMBLY_ACC=CAM_ASM_000658 /LENGTH=354 /DNA_ID=CAMNT_0015382381 /DNA_START=29 /DNA_END=1093 /DNA_ORIENTATION=+
MPLLSCLCRAPPRKDRTDAKATHDLYGSVFSGTSAPTSAPVPAFFGISGISAAPSAAPAQPSVPATMPPVAVFAAAQNAKSAPAKSAGNESGASCPCLPSKATDTGANWYRRDNGTGTWGGKCTCPDGRSFDVADNNDNCHSLACEGGSAGVCGKDLPASAAHMRVTCDQGAPAKEGPENCANEGGMCYCQGTVSFTDGKGHTMSKQVDGAISCDVANFGDPMVGARKSCVCTPGPGAQCATNGGTCECSGVVKYGANNHWATKAVDGHVVCNSATFGGVDPSGEGTGNSCFCIPKWKKCADEGQTCQCKGTVQYGVGRAWTSPHDVQKSIKCNNTEFGDPDWLHNKSCYCLSG